MKIASVYIPRVARALIASDILIVTGSLAFVMGIAKGLNAGNMTTLSAVEIIYLAVILAGATLFILVCNFAMGLYQRRFIKGRKLLQSIIISALISLVGLLFMDNLLLQNKVRFVELASIHFAMFALMAAMRPLACRICQAFVPKRRLAFVGSPTMAEKARWVVEGAYPSDAVLVDHYDFDTTAGYAGLDATLETIRNNPDVDEVFVEMTSPDLAQYSVAGARMPLNPAVSLFDRYARWTDNEMMNSCDTEMLTTNGYSSFWMKRIIETFVALIILVFFLPIILFTMIAIKLDDGGSLFYRQTRVGKHGKHFSVLKFRSMVENAEQAGSPQWASVGDSRVTRIGKILRKSRIDELPQLLNIIKGDMALVGPRPERPEFVEELAREIPNFELRHVVRPGLTGWAQISYPYGASLEDARWKTRFDLYYINNWTIWFDIAIIVQTVRVVLLAEGSR